MSFDWPLLAGSGRRGYLGAGSGATVRFGPKADRRRDRVSLGPPRISKRVGDMTSEAIIALAVIASIAALAYRQRGSSKLAFGVEFEAAIFDTPAGRLSGSELRVVHYVFQELRGNEGGRGLRTGWWYCVAPDSRRLMVIGQDDLVGMVRVETKWVVRELTEAQMRGALSGVPDGG